MMRSAHATEPPFGPPSDLTAQYQASPEGFDELIDKTGAVRPHWAPLVAELAALAPEMRSARLEQINAKVRETGIAHDLYADPGSLAQPWRIDLVPLMIPAEGWRWLERALVQRARLFEAVLADLYGPQRLLAQGAIPHRLVFSDPAYLRPCRHLAPAHGFIQFLAADIARSPDGRWRVIDTHAETPAGIGYALANRMVHTNVAGDMFTAAKALRQAPFFERLRAALVRRANRPDPAIALLTAGPRHNDFFSHAYLARYLGLLLVEGGDLRVTDGCIALKTLHGLMPIDLIVRCIAGAASDPLELEADFAGPVGLLGAVRRNPDLSANALGAALAENRGLSAYLPQLARALLGEDLMLEDGQRWWLGDPANRAHVSANLDRVVIRTAHEGTARPGRAVPGIDPARLSREERAALLAEIELKGAELVAEAKTGFGTTPSLTPAGLAPKPYALRLFVAAVDGGFAVLPGGIAMTIDPERTVALSAPDGESRDVWIVDEAPPAPHVSLWRPTVEAARIRRPAEELPSRAAENLFWLGRYAERADWSMRVLRTSLGRLQEDRPTRQSLPACRTALELLLSSEVGGELPGKREQIAPVLIERLAGILMTSAEQPFGLPRLIDNLHRVAGMTRDRLSSEAWRTLNDFHATRCWRAGDTPPELGDALRQLDDGLRTLAAFNGLTDENFTRGHGWSFLDLGRRLARANSLAALLRALFGRLPEGSDESGSLLFTLEVADSFITYRSRYRLEPMLPLLLDLLLADESNPRGLAFQLVRIEQHIESLPQSGAPSGAGGSRMEEQRLALSLLTAVRLADVTALARADAGGERTDLQRLLDEATAGLSALPDAIGRRYFDLLEKGVKWVRMGAHGGAQGGARGAS